MIRKVQIANYKSISKLSLELGRVTVLIGPNGSGKSNVLEALALASAASQSKLDNEFLIARGIRVTETRFMRSAFNMQPEPSHNIRISFDAENEANVEKVSTQRIPISLLLQGDDDVEFECELAADEKASYPKWEQLTSIKGDEFITRLRNASIDLGEHVTKEVIAKIVTELREQFRIRNVGAIPGFLIYAPENSALRTFQSEGQILPLGIRGEGLFAHLKGLNADPHKSRLREIKQKLKLLDWFETFEIPDNLGHGERSIRIRDRYLAKGDLFDQRSANEGFLFLLFYLTLFISPDTPAFFSIDNIESSLNPKLCIKLMQQIVELAKEYEKQVILTTHNPPVLDGLDLQDDEQRLFVVDRSKLGHTRVRRVDPPQNGNHSNTVSLSEAFLRGYIGGLPKNF